MARSMANQQQLFAPETEKNIAETTGFQGWTGLKLMPGWDGEANPYMGGSSKVPTSVEMVDEKSKISVEMSADFNHLGYPAASRIALPVTTTPGGGTISRQHVFSLNAWAEDLYRTWTLLVGDGFQAQQIVGALFDTLGIDIKRGALAFSTSMIGKTGEYGFEIPTNEVQTLSVTGGTPVSGGVILTLPFLNSGLGAATASILYNSTAAQVKAAIALLPGIDSDDLVVTGGPWPGTPIVVKFVGRWAQKNLALMTAVDTFSVGDLSIVETTTGAKPTVIADAPIPAIAWDIFADDTYAGIGSTKLLACYQGKLDFGSKFDPDAPINSAITSYESLLEKKDQGYGFDMVLGVDAVATGLIASFKAGTRKFIRMVVEGPTIEGAIKYKAQLDFPILILGRGEVGEAPNSPAVSIPLKATVAVDYTTLDSFKLTLINTVTSY